MESTTVTAIGFFAAFCTTVALLPQVFKIIQTKHTKDISLWMYVIFLIGLISWLTYGILLNDLPIIIANVITVLLAMVVFIFKIKYK